MLYFECFCNVSVIWFWGVGETLKIWCFCFGQDFDLDLQIFATYPLHKFVNSKKQMIKRVNALGILV